MFSGYAKPNMFNNHQLRLIKPPPLLLKYLAYWKLAAILDGKEFHDSGSNKRIPTNSVQSNIFEFPTQEVLISTCKKAATLMHRKLL
jgi:hypothetical protein